MKITQIFIPLAAGLLVAVASCDQKSNNGQQDGSDAVADSIALQEAQIEQARLDSIRQDSLRQDSIRQEQEKIAKAMPTVQMFGHNLKDMDMGELTDVDILRKKLMALGYERINANKYVLNPDGEPSVTVVLHYESWEGEYIPEIGDYVGAGMSYSIDIIFSDEKDAADFYKKWKSVCKSNWIEASRSGRKVELSTYGD